MDDIKWDSTIVLFIISALLAIIAWFIRGIRNLAIVHIKKNDDRWERQDTINNKSDKKFNKQNKRIYELATTAKQNATNVEQTLVIIKQKLKIP